MKVIGNLTKDAIIRAAVSEGFTVSNSVGSGVVFETANTQGLSAAYDTSNDKVVVAFRDSGANGQAIVGTVSGDSISFGTPVVFNSAQIDNVASAFDTSANKVVIAYRESGGKAIVGTVSGTSISFGSEVQFESGAAYNNAVAYDANANKTVIAYRDNGDSDKGKAVVGTVSGTSISFGSIVNFDTENSRDMVMSYDPVAQKILLVYKIQSSPNPGYSIVGTVSGTSISFGTRVEYHAGSTDVNRVVYDSNAQKHVILFRDQDTSPYSGKIIEATISGTSVSYGTEFQWSSTSFSEPAITYDPDQKKVVLAYVDSNNSTYGTARVYTTGYTSATGGTIADGSAVIVNANGTVSSVSQSTLTEAVGTPVQFEAATSYDQGIAYDSTNNKVVICYRDDGNSSYGTAIVGTVSGDSISFGTAVVFESAYSDYFAPVFDSSNGKIVVAYRDLGNSSQGTAIVGTVSGTSISFGSPTVFETGATTYVSTSFDSSANKVVIVYRDGSDNYGKAIVGTVSDTSISFGSTATFSSATTSHMSVAYDVANNKHVVGYYASSGNAKVGTVSDTSISFGSAAEFETGQTIQTNAVYDSKNEKVHMFYVDGGDSDYGKARIGTVSGTSISFTGQSTFYNSGQISWLGASFNSTVDKITLSFRTSGNVLYVIAVTPSASSYSFGSAFTIDSTISNGRTPNVHDVAAQKTVLAYSDGADSNKGTAAVYTAPGDVPNLTTENFVGFMKGAALDGTNGEILSSCSIARNQTSLTPGQTYFVSPTDGALSTSAGSPSFTAGTAISNTELKVKG